MVRSRILIVWCHNALQAVFKQVVGVVALLALVLYERSHATKRCSAMPYLQVTTTHGLPLALRTSWAYPTSLAETGNRRGLLGVLVVVQSMAPAERGVEMASSNGVGRDCRRGKVCRQQGDW